MSSVATNDDADEDDDYVVKMIIHGKTLYFRTNKKEFLTEHTFQFVKNNANLSSTFEKKRPAIISIQN